MNSHPDHRPARTHRGFITPVGFVAAMFAALWLFSTLGLGMYAGVMVLGGMALVLGLALLAWRFGAATPFTRLSVVWPLLLALLWICWWPALDYWAVKELPSFARTGHALPWWDTSAAKWGGALLMLGLGCGTRLLLGRVGSWFSQPLVNLFPPAEDR